MYCFHCNLFCFIQTLGNVKSLLLRWTGKDLENKAWYSSLDKTAKAQLKKYQLGIEDLNAIDDLLGSIKFPENALRAMPKLSPTFGNGLKSMEYEIILFYGFLCFKSADDDDEDEGLPISRRFHNFKQLAWILSELSSRTIMKRTDLRHVENEIERFLKAFDQIYTENEGFMWRINIHSIIHYCDLVRTYGPLPVWSAYPTEDAVRRAANLVQTGTHIPQQVMNKFVLQYSVLSRAQQLIKMNTTSTKFIELTRSLCPHLCPPIQWDPSKLITVKQYYSAPYRPSGQELNFCSADQKYRSIKRVGWLPKDAKKPQTICTRLHNQNSAKTTINHCIKTKSGEYYLIETMLQATGSKEIFFLGYELCGCKPIPLYDINVKWQKKILESRGLQSLRLLKFGYVSSFSQVSKKLSKLDPNNFQELSTYSCIYGVNYALDLFNKHY